MQIREITISITLMNVNSPPTMTHMDVKKKRPQKRIKAVAVNHHTTVAAQMKQVTSGMRGI